MLGYIINFYKYATFPHVLKGDMADYLKRQLIHCWFMEILTD